MNSWRIINLLKQKSRYIFDTEKDESKKISEEIEIRVVNNVNLFKDFFNVHWLVYKNDKSFVSPLWQEYTDFFKTKSKFWDHAESRLFIAYKNGKAVGRIAAIIDFLFIKQEKEKIGYFGFFEAIKEYKIAKALFDSTKKWLKEKRIEKMRGPIDGRVDIRTGFLLNGYNEQPYIFGSYNPKYYIDFIEKYKMKKCRDQLVYYLDLKDEIPDYLKKAAEKVKKMGIKIRGFNRLRAGNEIKWWMPMMMKTFSFHWGFVNVSNDEIRNRFGVKQIRWVADPGLFLVAESPDGKPIAFKWTTPDYNQAFKKLKGKLGIIGIFKFFLYKLKINRGRLNFVGIKKEWRGKGLGSAMNYWTMLEMKKRGYSGAECGWIDEKNIASQKTIEKTGAKLHKKYRVYEIKI